MKKKNANILALLKFNNFTKIKNTFTVSSLKALTLKRHKTLYYINLICHHHHTI